MTSRGLSGNAVRLLIEWPKLRQGNALSSHIRLFAASNRVHRARFVRAMGAMRSGNWRVFWMPRLPSLGVRNPLLMSVCLHPTCLSGGGQQSRRAHPPVIQTEGGWARDAHHPFPPHQLKPDGSGCEGSSCRARRAYDQPDGGAAAEQGGAAAAHPHPLDPHRPCARPHGLRPCQPGHRHGRQRVADRAAVPLRLCREPALEPGRRGFQAAAAAVPHVPRGSPCP